MHESAGDFVTDRVERIRPAIEGKRRTTSRDLQFDVLRIGRSQIDGHLHVMVGPAWPGRVSAPDSTGLRLIRQQAMRKPPDWDPAAHSRNSGPASFANRVGEQALVSGGH